MESGYKGHIECTGLGETEGHKYAYMQLHLKTTLRFQLFYVYSFGSGPMLHYGS